jgi:hypothetical protein
MFAPVIMFLHRKENEWANFYQIETARKDSLKLTGNHLIYSSDCDPRTVIKMNYARTVKVGDCVFVATDANKLVSAKVTNITMVRTVLY